MKPRGRPAHRSTNKAGPPAGPRRARARQAGCPARRQAVAQPAVVERPKRRSLAFARRGGADRPGPDRHGHAGRERHAGRPLSRGALSRPVLQPYPARDPQRRVAGQRQAYRTQEPAGGGPADPHSAAAARSGKAAPREQQGRRDPRLPQIHHALRGRRRDGAEQAGRACGAGRLRHHSPSRRHAGRDPHQGRPASAPGASARQGYRRLSAGREVALCGGRARQDVPLALGAQDLLGAGAGRAEAETGPDLDLSRQGAARGRFGDAGRAAWRGGRLRMR